MENVLLHSCCAPCSAAIVEWMLAQDIRPTLYYFNPNIFPQEEYEIRKSECSRYAQKLGLEIIDGDYDHTAWLSDWRAWRMNPNGESDVCSVSKYGCWPRQNWLMKEAFVCLLLHWPLAMEEPSTNHRSREMGCGSL